MWLPGGRARRGNRGSTRTQPHGVTCATEVLTAMLKCPYCQFDNEDGALFCEQCKSDLGGVAAEAVPVAAAVAVEAAPMEAMAVEAAPMMAEAAPVMAEAAPVMEAAPVAAPAAAPAAPAG